MSISEWVSGIRAARRKARGQRNEVVEWEKRSYAAPSPSHIKRSVLLRLGAPSATWVETGTFMGDTAALLAVVAKVVFTIEPEGTLYEKAAVRFSGDQRVRPIYGLSEEVFPRLLPTLSGDVNFWLDGHYSGGITHQGPTDCPVREELANIAANLKHFSKVVVLIDDVRCFNPSLPEYKDYPALNYLVDWARGNGMQWHIEHDIFCCKNF